MKNHLIFRKENKDLYLAYSPKADNFYSLNYSSYIILRELDAGCTPQEVASKLTREFDVSSSDAKQNVLDAIKLFVGAPTSSELPDLSSPLRVAWRVTNACNLSCKHCYTSSGKISHAELTTEESLQAIDKLCKWGIFEVEITGGEPFTRPDIFKIIRAFSDKDISIVIFTNATLINKFKNDLSGWHGRFNVSLDGDMECHDAIRGKGTFEKTVRNISLLINHGHKVTVHMAINRLNLKSLPSFVDIARELNVPFHVGMVVPEGRAEQSLCLSQEQYRESLDTLVKKAEQDGIDFVGFEGNADSKASDFIVTVSENHGTILYEDYWQCNAARTKLTISPNGDVVPCPLSREYLLGNIVKDEIKTIWNSANRSSFISHVGKSSKRVCKPVQSRLLIRSDEDI